MKFVNFPALGEGYHETILDSGLRIRVIPKPGFAKKYAFVAVDYGAIDTAFTFYGKDYRTPDGVAHYLEHKMFDMPYGDAMNRFAALGGSPNAFTSHTLTAYYVECTENLQENLETLLQFVFTPYFTQKSVDKEQGIIAQEIGMYRDSADSRVYENLFSALYDHHPIRVPIAGTEESIREITPETLTLCHKAFYTPQNAMLCVMGDVQPEEIAAWAEQYLPTCGDTKAKAFYGAEETLLPKEKRVEETMEVAMPTFLVGFKDVPATGPASMKQEFIGDLTADLLFGSSASFYTELYEKSLIDSSFAAGYEGFKGAAVFTAGGDSKDPEKVAEAILKEKDRILRHGADEEAFRRLKKAMLGRKLRSLDSFESTVYRMCAYFFEGVEYFDFYDILQSVTLEDVQNYIRRTLREERMAMSIISPGK